MNTDWAEDFRASLAEAAREDARPTGAWRVR
jgi:hypothetical protein